MSRLEFGSMLIALAVLAGCAAGPEDARVAWSEREPAIAPAPVTSTLAVAAEEGATAELRVFSSPRWMPGPATAPYQGYAVFDASGDLVASRPGLWLPAETIALDPGRYIVVTGSGEDTARVQVVLERGRTTLVDLPRVER